MADRLKLNIRRVEEGAPIEVMIEPFVCIPTYAPESGIVVNLNSRSAPTFYLSDSTLKRAMKESFVCDTDGRKHE